MIRIAICDDEETIRTDLKDMISEYGKKQSRVFKITCYQSGEEMLEAGICCDVLFLDIDMQGRDGIRIGKEVWNNNRKVKIIYVSNLVQYKDIAQNNIHAFAYLVKPIKKEELFSQLEDVLLDIYKAPEFENVFLDTLFKGVINYNVDDIYYFEYRDRKVKMVTKKETVEVKETLSSLENRFKSMYFERIHQGFIINMKYIQKFVENDVQLMNGDRIPIAQKRQAQFRKQFAEYISKKYQ